MSSPKPVPTHRWGKFSEGAYANHLVIVVESPDEGWEICLLPPKPSDDIFDELALSESDLYAWFNHSPLNDQEIGEWITPGLFAEVEWMPESFEPDDPRTKKLLSPNRK